MKHVYWLRKGKIAGRSGPNSKFWDLNEIKANGFSAILSVNNGEAVHESMLSNLEIAYSNIPMSSNAPVRVGDRELCLENLPKAMAFIRENMAKGPVLIHCRAGKDRTGMVLAAYLIDFEGYSAEEAIDKVLSVRPIAFSAEGWMNFGLEVLALYKTLDNHMQSDPALGEYGRNSYEDEFEDNTKDSIRDTVNRDYR